MPTITPYTNMLQIKLSSKCKLDRFEFILEPYLMPGPADNGGEDGPGGVVSSEAGLAHAGAVVNDQGGNLIITHLGI